MCLYVHQSIAVTHHFRTPGAREDVVAFFDGKELGSATRAVNQVSPPFFSAIHTYLALIDN
jgi:hypothetical protein